MSLLRVGVTGYGYTGSVHAQVLLAEPGARLTAIAYSQADRLGDLLQSGTGLNETGIIVAQAIVLYGNSIRDLRARSYVHLRDLVRREHAHHDGHTIDSRLECRLHAFA